MWKRERELEVWVEEVEKEEESEKGRPDRFRRKRKLGEIGGSTEGIGGGEIGVTETRISKYSKLISSYYDIQVNYMEAFNLYDGHFLLLDFFLKK